MVIILIQSMIMSPPLWFLLGPAIVYIQKWLKKQRKRQTKSVKKKRKRNKKNKHVTLI